MSDAPLPAADAKDTYARNAAVMTVGTSLSRFTGFLRIATQTAVLGVTANALADTYNTANTTPNGAGRSASWAWSPDRPSAEGSFPRAT